MKVQVHYDETNFLFVGNVIFTNTKLGFLTRKDN